MAPRTTLNDRARKARIREREFRELNRRMRKLDAITEEQLATLKKIKAAEVKSKPLMAAKVDGWRDLREMGAVKEQDGALVLTAIGAQVVSDGEAAK